MTVSNAIAYRVIVLLAVPCGLRPAHYIKAIKLMTTLTAQAATQANSLQAIFRREDRAKQACYLAGINVNYPDNARGHRVTYTSGNNRLAFKQDKGYWVEINEMARGRFSRDNINLISTHLGFYSDLVEA
jgi:hypothetical protein